MGRGSWRAARERGNLSFCIVVIFFGVFAAIVLTEVLLIDSSARAGRAARARATYDESVVLAQHGEDYLLYQGGMFQDKDGRKSVQPTATTNMSATDGQWQTVAGTRYKFFVFSAYFDSRGGRVVRIVGATKTRGPDRVWCLFYHSSGNSTFTLPVVARVRVIRENWNLKYSACFILCPVQGEIPSSVSVVSKARLAPTNRLVVHHQFNTSREIPSPPRGSVEVCVKPLHFHYNNAMQMIEFIELNSILGMGHFTFYNNTIGDGVNCVLQHYQAQGRVSVLPWRLDMASQKEIRTEGLFAALNDCLYRAMHRAAFVALIDLDEIIMPRHNDTIQQLIQWMGERVNTKSTGSYSFQNGFFYLQWGDDKIVAREGFAKSLTTMRKTCRKAKLHPHKQRSKYICRPEFVVEAGNHFVWEFVPGHGTLNVPPDAAILNHYRVCEFGGDDCVRSPSVIDRTAHRYLAKLSSRVQAVWTTLEGPCGLPSGFPFRAS